MAEFHWRPRCLLGAFVAILLLFSPIGAQSSGTPANELFVSAVMLHRQSADLPPSERNAKLREVRDLFDRIIADHPDSRVADILRTDPAPAGVVLADLPPSSDESIDILQRFQKRYPDDYSAFQAEFGLDVAEKLAVALMDAFEKYGIVETVSALKMDDGWGLIGFARGQNLDEIPTSIAIEYVATTISTWALDTYARATGADVDSATLVELGSPAAQFIIAGVNGASGAGPAVSAGVVAAMQAYYAARSSYSEDARFEEISGNLVLADALRQIAAGLLTSEQPDEAERLQDRAELIIEAAAQDAQGVFEGSDGPVVADMLREMDDVVQLLRAGEQQKAQKLFRSIHTAAEANAPGFFSLSTNNAYERYFMVGPQNRADTLRAFDQLAHILHAIFEKPNATENVGLGRETVDGTTTEATNTQQRQDGAEYPRPWVVQKDPDLTLKTGEQGLGFAVSADGAATFGGNSLFGDYRAQEPSYQRLAIFIGNAERHAVALFMRDGAERMALVDLEAAAILNDAPRPFWRYGPPDDVIWDPLGRYAAVRLPMAEYSTGLGVFELSTGDYAVIPDRAFDANARDYWLADSLRTRRDGSVAVQIALQKLDAHGTPMPSGGNPPETRNIDVAAAFDAPSPDSESPRHNNSTSQIARAPWSFETNAVGEAAIREIVEGFVGGPVEVILGYADAFPFAAIPPKKLAVDVFTTLPEADIAEVAGTKFGYGSFKVKEWSALNRFYFEDEPVEGFALASLGTVDDLRILSVKGRTGSSCEWSVTYRLWLTDRTPFGKALEQVSDEDGLTFAACFRTTRDGYDISEYRYVD